MLNKYKKFLEDKMYKILGSLVSKGQVDFRYYYYADFIDDEYFAVMGDEKVAFLVILNSHKDDVFKLEVETTNYMRIRKFDLKNQISPKSYRKLINNGLFMDLYSGKNNNNGYIGVHRLMACLRENVLGKVVHHIDDDPLNNEINNLQALLPEEHTDKTTQNRTRRRMLNGQEYITL